MPRYPTHPGELLREDVIPATGKSKAEIARMLGVSRQHLHDVLAERKPVSPEVAVRLAKLFGNAPLVWIRIQGVMMPGTPPATSMCRPSRR